MTSTLHRALLAAAVLAWLAPLPVAAGPRPPTPEERDLLRALHGAPRRSPAPPPAAGQDDFDALDYDLTLWLDLDGERIEGTSVVTFEPAPGVDLLDELVLDLHDGSLEVTEVTYDGAPVPLGDVSHAGDVLRIPLAPPLASGAGAARVAVSYQGQPLELGFGTLTFTTHGDPPEPVIFTLSEPFLGRGWWPSKDLPHDKATVTLRVEAPEELVVVSNGLLQSVVPGRPGHSVTTWRESYPISTYLVAMSASDYVSWEETYVALDGTPVPVRHWVYPELREAGEEDFSVTVPMMELFATLFDEYPFIDEKYGHVTVPMGGAMEHQTATSYGARLVRGDHAYDWVVAHELAHQWWGDLVGPASFISIWLNEGFATYSEALWWEAQNGRAAYHDYMLAMDRWLTRGREFDGTVHDPDATFNATVYDKGAWVLHMLRWLLGQPSTSPDPEPLLEVLRAHGDAHPYGSASTDDLVATASAVAGSDLSWFFDQWVRRSDRPDYGVGWAAAPQPDGSFELHLRVEQLQPGDPYAMPVLVRLELPSGVREELVWNDARLADDSWSLPEEPVDVAWDPDGWILKKLTPIVIDRDGDGWPDWLDGCPDVPNPLQEDDDGDGVQDACQTGIDFDGDGTLNEEDCAAADGEVWSEPAGPTRLLATKAPDGAPRLVFEHPDPLGQRAYTADVAAGELAALRATGGHDDAACLVAGHTGPDYTAPAPAGSIDTYYIVWPWNGCGATAGGGVPLSICR